MWYDKRVLVLAGRGRYEDPWHDHAATSYAVAVELESLGVEVRIRSTFAAAFALLDEVDLLVVNCGRGRTDPAFDGTDEQWRQAHADVDRYARSGRAILGLHQAANTFPDNPGWRSILGGRWIPGHSMHPPQSVATFTPAGVPLEGVDSAGAVHPVVDGLGPVVADDEQYCELDVAETSQILLTTHHDGVDQPVAWLSSGARAIYDGLGHGVESYASDSRRRLLHREAMWLLGAPDSEVRAA
ncbi:ThuA domain-containing protein [Hamadaea sp. NPDC051192]|uniref:ThuA domain-containing protein n=1 Tax=Hamadaea sp. NPDC051192 TaxID=3154940 RepID=UPI003421434E